MAYSGSGSGAGSGPWRAIGNPLNYAELQRIEEWAVWSLKTVVYSYTDWVSGMVWKYVWDGEWMIKDDKTQRGNWHWFSCLAFHIPSSLYIGYPLHRPSISESPLTSLWMPWKTNNFDKKWSTRSSSFSKHHVGLLWYRLVDKDICRGLIGVEMELGWMKSKRMREGFMRGIKDAAENEVWEVHMRGMREGTETSGKE